MARCDHPDFEASVRVSDTVDATGAVVGYEAEVVIRCAACQEPLRSQLAPRDPTVYQMASTSDQGTRVWLKMQMLPPTVTQAPEVWAVAERQRYEGAS